MPLRDALRKEAELNAVNKGVYSIAEECRFAAQFLSVTPSKISPEHLRINDCDIVRSSSIFRFRFAAFPRLGVKPQPSIARGLGFPAYGVVNANTW